MTSIDPSQLASVTGGGDASQAMNDDGWKNIQQACPVVSKFIDRQTDPNKPSLAASACAAEFFLRNPSMTPLFLR